MFKVEKYFEHLIEFLLKIKIKGKIMKEIIYTVLDTGEDGRGKIT